MRIYTQTLILFRVLVFIIFSNFVGINAQSICPIWTASEPVVANDYSINFDASQSGKSYSIPWDFKFNTVGDDSLSVELSNQKSSYTLKFNNLNLDIPDGALIQGIKLSIEGKSIGNGYVSDVNVSLGLDDKVSANYAGKGHSSKKVWAKTSSYSHWNYGHDYDTWGKDWTSTELNDSDFSIFLKIRNILKDDVLAIIKNVKVEVTYLPLPTFCNATCPTFYVDDLIEADYYDWDVPEGFTLISKEEKNIIDLHINNETPNGIYEICVDGIKNGNTVSSCCRKFRYIICEPGSIGDFVWSDINRNGLQDTGELGVSDVLVNLFDLNNNFIASTSTDANGSYLFDQVERGRYYIQLMTNDNFEFTQPEIGNEDFDSNILLNNEGKSKVFLVDYAQNVNNIDAGLVQLVSIEGKAWEDIYADGQREAGDSGISNVEVILYDDSGVIVAQTNTDAEGDYIFENVNLGFYKIAFVFDSTYQDTPKFIGSPLSDSDINNDLTTDLISVGANGATNIDAGVFMPADLSGIVWNDQNCDGLYQVGEPLFDKVKIFLIDGNNAIVDSSQTLNDGSFTFNNTIPGNYSLQLIDVADYTATTKQQSILNVINDELISDQILVGSGQNVTGLDLGLVEYFVSICGQVWLDSNFDGLRDADEINIVLDVIYLMDSTGVRIDSSATDSDGKYCFYDLEPGRYQVQFIKNDQQLFSPHNTSMIEINSDVINEEGFTEFITLESGKKEENLDAGIGNKASIGDFVWLDDNRNGLQDANEFGVADVKVLLYNESNQLIDSVFTNTTGNYIFDQLIPGNYYLSITFNEDYKAILKNGVDNEIDSDITNANGINTTDLITINANDIIINIDFGLEENLGTICGLIWMDEEANGVRSPNESKGFEGAVIEALNANGIVVSSSISDEEGRYCLESLPPNNYTLRISGIPSFYQISPVGIGGDPTVDCDFNKLGLSSSISLGIGQLIENIDAGLSLKSALGNFVWMDENNDGLQDQNEPGISGVEVKLFDTSNSLIGTTLTDGAGFYQFLDVPAGVYYMTFKRVTDLEFTLQNVSPDKGSDADGNGRTPDIVVVGNIDNFDIDAGLIVSEGSIEGTVWEDTNKNGQRDSNEQRLEGIKVTLFNAFQNEIMSAFTNANGEYKFSGLLPNNYVVGFENLDRQPFTIGDFGLDDTDSDVTSDFFEGSTGLIVLNAGDEITWVDAGYLSVAGSIKGVAFEDMNGNGIKDANDALKANVMVQLYKTDSILVANEITDVDGAYSFGRVEDGNYFITYSLGDSSYFFTTPYVGNDSLIDSDVTGYYFGNSTDSIQISGDTMICGVNAGYVGFSTIKGLSFLDENENGIRESVEVGFNEVIVHLIDSLGNVVAIDTTQNVNGTNGVYAFDGLMPGKYLVSFTRPLYYAVSPKDQGGNDTIDCDFTLMNNFEGVSDTLLMSSKSNFEFLDFGLFYKLERNSSISGEVWIENEVNGLDDTSELRYEGVALSLFTDTNDLIGTVISEADGSYNFSSLTEGFYYIIADLPIEETATFYNVGNDPTINNDFIYSNSQIQTDIFYLAVLEDTMSIDLGVGPAVNIGDQVWEDLDFDGQYIPTEPGFEGAILSLWDSNGNFIAQRTTDANGSYEFRRIPASSYQLSIELPLDYSLTRSNLGSPLSDSDFNGNGFSDIITLTTFGNIDTIDAGVVTSGAIGDKMFVDFNGNGIQNAGEPGMSDYYVELYDVQNNLIARDTTRGDMMMGLGGFYTFDDVRPGEYYLVFYLKEDYLFTSANIGSDDTDSDVTSAITEGSTDIFTLLPGEMKTNMDCGIFAPGSLGDFVWDDLNSDGIQDMGEPGIEGVEVKLLRSNGQVLATTTTDAEGYYVFGDLKQGLYSLEFEILPTHSFTLKDNAPDDETDSDADEITGRTSLISLAHGATFLGVDCGYIFTNVNGPITHENNLVKHESIPTKVLTPMPNPAVYETWLKVDDDGKYRLEVLNTEGKLLSSTTEIASQGLIRVDISKYDTGKLYFKLYNQFGSYKGSLIRVY